MDQLSFEGLKFWISSYVPKWIKFDIRKRKGEIVILERDADICLVDHNQYVPYPEKYYSYLWIKECITRNAKVDESNFLVAELRKNMPAASQAARPSASYVPASRDPAPMSYAAHQLVNGTKRTRTPFTNEDDQILINWLKKEGSLVSSTKNGFSGNELYKRLEAQYPHHTYHSWRDRWIKKLSRIVSLDTMALPERSTAPERPPSPPPLRPAAHRAAEAPAPPEEPAPPVRAVQPPILGTQEGLGDSERVPFLTTMDMIILRATWRETQTGEQKTLPAFFKSLAEKHPSVSVKSWRDRYMRLRTWYEKIDVFDQVEDRHIEESSVPSPPRRPRDSDHQADAYSRSRNGYYGDDNNGANNDANNDANSESTEDGGDDDNGDFDATTLLDEVSVQDEAQRRFYGDVDLFNSMDGGYFIPRAIVIGGRLLEIWTLWAAVREVAPDPKTRDWGKVVEALSFDTDKHPAIRQELEIWYGHNLADLEQARADFDAGEAAVAPPYTQTEQPTGAKRRLFAAFGDDDEDVLDEDDEDDDGDDRNDDNLADDDRHGRRSHGVAGRANKRRRASEIQPPSEDDGEDDSVFMSRATAAAAAAAASAEPETQDFAYGRRTQAVTDDEDEIDEEAYEEAYREDEDGDEDEDALSRQSGVQVTPSQQLQMEVGVVEAVPLSLPGRRSVGQSNGTAAAAASAPKTTTATEKPEESAESATARTPAPAPTVRRSLPAWFGRDRDLDLDHDRDRAPESQTLPSLKEAGGA